MSAIYGLIRLDDAPAAADELRAMREAIGEWGPDGGGVWLGAGAGLGQLVLRVTPESAHERGPLVAQDGGLVLTAAARLDNRDELLARFDVPQDTTESALIMLAYETWGDDTPLHLFGDWAFAAWHPRERRLFLARDQFGNTALYYHRDARAFAFASGRNAILALPHVPRRLDELRLAQQLTFWIADAHRTSYEDVHRLPPAHAITLRASHADVREYWKMEDAPQVRLASDDAYVERFVELYERAVRVRLRSSRPIGSTLSAGLDSGSVSALAARELRARGETLTAFTAVPFHILPEMPGVLVDEWPLAHETASWCGNVAHIPIRAEGVTPLQAIERMLDAHQDPEGGAANLHWMTALFDEARRRNIGVLLTGQFGNGGVSWGGDPFRTFRRLRAGDVAGTWRGVRDWRHQHRHSWPRALWWTIVRPIAARVRTALIPRAVVRDAWPARLINPSFARRLRIAERMRETGYRRSPEQGSSIDARLATLLPGVTPAGALWHEGGANARLDARDPTADVRLLEYCLGIPDDLFARREGSRWLMRRSMTGILPPSVQWNARRGVQGADLTHRLQADGEAVSAVVLRIASSERASRYLDVAAMQQRWTDIVSSSTKHPSGEAVMFATSLLIGSFLLRFPD